MSTEGRKTWHVTLTDGSEFLMVHRHSGFARFAIDVIRRRDFNGLEIESIITIDPWWDFNVS